MKVQWTNRAKSRLHLIYEYIAEDSPKTALKVIDRLTNRSRQLNALPNTGRRVAEYDQDDIRELLERPYRIIYRIKPEQIDILTVMHYRQILPKDIQQL